MAGLISSMADAEATAAARSAYARHTEDHITPTRRPSRKSRTSQGSHFEVARRRSTRSTTSTTQKHEPASDPPALAAKATMQANLPVPVLPTVAALTEDKPVQVLKEAYLTVSTETTAARAVKAHTPTPRHLSTTIKGRLKQVFRKATPASMPPAAPPSSPEPAAIEGQALSNSAPEPEPYNRPYSTSTKSRVTSWTNSTIAAMSSIRSNRRPSHHFDPPPEPVLELNSRGLRKRSSFFTGSARNRNPVDPAIEPIISSVNHELRKKSSFFGGPVRNRLNRSSRAELSGASEESAGLYSALQKRIRPSRSGNLTDGTETSRLFDASTLHDTSFFEPTLPTIRTITPDPGLCTVDIPSPVNEIGSPGSSLKRRSALRIPHTSRADVISPSVYSRATDGASPRPLSPDADEGTTTILITGREVRRYSISPAKPRGGHHRGSGSGSWRKWLSDEMKTSLGTGGPQYQSLTVPSNEQYMQARRTPSPAMQSLPQYDVSPAKPPTVYHRGHGSGSWRKWLSDEMRTTLGSEEQQFRLLNSATIRPRSISPLSELGREAGRSRSQASSIVSTMHDRHPKVASSRTSLRDNHNAASFRAPSRGSYQETVRSSTRQSYQEPSRTSFSRSQHENGRLSSVSRPVHSYSSKENIRPASAAVRPPASPLPSLSSSQWLATGSHKSRSEVRRTSLKDAVAKPSLSRASMRNQRNDAHKSTLSRASMLEMRDHSRRSPGQHMVTDWLKERKSKESIVRRAELEDTSVGGSAFL
ncbi:hypothetical protein Slin15195_G062320 [Septoria linicola]|uniref:Uncharacterized protein n=1 Tax=Septoria linicola TaxID=215465 RepID=A0A9Q9ATI9_9PEZI|nr:hypothetical protein Slin15195_G062320 [Septoria linicola]